MPSNRKAIERPWNFPKNDWFQNSLKKKIQLDLFFICKTLKSDYLDTGSEISRRKFQLREIIKKLKSFPRIKVFFHDGISKIFIIVRKLLHLIAITILKLGKCLQVFRIQMFHPNLLHPRHKMNILSRILTYWSGNVLGKTERKKILFNDDIYN